MWGTSITDQTGVEIAKSIAQNSTLQIFKIDMRSTSITDQTGLQIAKAIAQHSTLQKFEIGMWGTSISEVDRSKFHSSEFQDRHAGRQHH